MFRRLARSLKNSFLVGLVAILPLYVTFRVAVALIHYVDRAVAPDLLSSLPYRVPGIGIALTLLVITLAGYLMRFVVVREAGRGLEQVVSRIPFLRTVYSAVKQVLLPLVGDEEHRAFKQVVLLEWPGNELWVMGFLVQERLLGSEPSPEDPVVVFLPTNHLHLGFVLTTRRGRLRPLDLSVEEAIKAQFSLGAAAPPALLESLLPVPAEAAPPLDPATGP